MGVGIGGCGAHLDIALLLYFEMDIPEVGDEIIPCGDPVLVRYMQTAGRVGNAAYSCTSSSRNFSSRLMLAYSSL